MSQSPLKYKDERDRALGLSGMSVALMLWDGEPMLAAVSLDGTPGTGLEFTPAYGFAGNPRLTATLAWREMLKQFELTAAMLLGNAMCRSYVGNSAPLGTDTAAALRQLLHDEGHETCQLDSDETDIIYNKTYRYLDRVFTHHAVGAVARDLAARLQSRRRMTATEVFEVLMPITRL